MKFVKYFRSIIMRINILNEVENFYEILTHTIILISQDPILSSQIIDSIDQPQYRLANEYLNFVIMPDTPSGALKNLYDEYSNTSIVWRKPVQKLVAYLSIHILLRPIFSQKRIKLPASILRDIVIIGGNHRIRFYNYKKNEMYVILKVGEDSSFIKHEIEIRKENSIPNVPTLKAHGEYWFKEEAVNGRPLNRLSIKEQKRIDSKKIILDHYKNSILPKMGYQKVSDYAKIIENDIVRWLEQKQCRNCTLLKLATDYLVETIIKYKDEPIPISISHGDLQKGNILINENNMHYLIDWESTCRRFILYDEYIYLSDNRVKTVSQTILIDNYLKNNMKCLDEFSIDIERNMKLFKYLLLLEELRFQIFMHNHLLSDNPFWVR